MRYRSLGESGLMVSVAGLGCNNFGNRVDLAGTRAVVDASTRRSADSTWASVWTSRADSGSSGLIAEA